MTDVPDLEVDVCVSCAGWKSVLPAPGKIALAAAHAAFRAAWPPPARVPARAAEASVLLADDGLVETLNRDYRGRDGATNVLSFSGLDEGGLGAGAPVLLGDIVVAYETAVAEAGAEGVSLADHLCHLVVHGMLHLLGYDHESEAEAARMERLESQVLASLGIAERRPERGTEC